MTPPYLFGTFYGDRMKILMIGSTGDIAKAAFDELSPTT